MTKPDSIENKQRNYYNTISSEYDLHYGNRHVLQYRYRIFDILLKNVNLKNYLVLDAMCGGGQSTGYFLKKGCRVIGLDISEEQCHYYKKRYPNFQVFCASIFSTNFPNNHFDFIITDSLHHLHPKVNEGFEELIRILKPGGMILLWEPTAKSIFDIFRKIWYRLDKSYFENNEKSINIDKLVNINKSKVEIVKKIYGGNLAYLFIQLTMPLRIPVKFIRYYSRPLISIERILMILQTRFTSMWFLALLRKKNY